jgi:hypothetical protein
MKQLYQCYSLLEDIDIKGQNKSNMIRSVPIEYVSTHSFPERVKLKTPFYMMYSYPVMVGIVLWKHDEMIFCQHNDSGKNLFVSLRRICHYIPHH